MDSTSGLVLYAFQTELVRAEWKKRLASAISRRDWASFRTPRTRGAQSRLCHHREPRGAGCHRSFGPRDPVGRRRRSAHRALREDARAHSRFPDTVAPWSKRRTRSQANWAAAAPRLSESPPRERGGATAHAPMGARYPDWLPGLGALHLLPLILWVIAISSIKQRLVSQLLRGEPRGVGSLRLHSERDENMTPVCGGRSLAKRALLGAMGPACILLIALVPGGVAKATDAAGAAGSEQLQEVVVTAEKREENIEKVPISVSVLSRDRELQRNITDMADVAAVTPGVDFQNQGSTIALAIRGISSGHLRILHDRHLP